jgi:hypothetical protein
MGSNVCPHGRKWTKPECRKHRKHLRQLKRKQEEKRAAQHTGEELLERSCGQSWKSQKGDFSAKCLLKFNLLAGVFPPAGWLSLAFNEATKSRVELHFESKDNHFRILLLPLAHTIHTQVSIYRGDAQKLRDTSKMFAFLNDEDVAFLPCHGGAEQQKMIMSTRVIFAQLLQELTENKLVDSCRILKVQ